MANPFYPKTTGNLNLYGTSTTGSEVDMRQELENLLDGYHPEIAKGQVALFRKMRRDSDGGLTACPCVDEVTNEPDKDRFCPICFGEGYMWDETEIDFYKVYEQSDTSNILKDKLHKPGLINQPLVVFYIRYSVEITKEDRIIEIQLDDDGTATDPMRRKRVFRIGNLWEYRCDNGRLEYWKVFGYPENVKYLNAPSLGDL